MVRKETHANSNDYWTRSIVARRMDQDWQSRSELRKTRMEKREAQTQQCSKTERNLHYCPDEKDYKENIKNTKRKWEGRMATAMLCKRMVYTGTTKVAAKLENASQKMHNAMKIPDAKAAVDKYWKKLETIPARQLENVMSKKEVVLEAQRDKKKIHFATLMDICHLKNAALEPKLKNYKGRVVL